MRFAPNGLDCTMCVHSIGSLIVPNMTTTLPLWLKSSENPVARSRIRKRRGNVCPTTRALPSAVLSRGLLDPRICRSEACGLQKTERMGAPSRRARRSLDVHFDRKQHHSMRTGPIWGAECLAYVERPSTRLVVIPKGLERSAPIRSHLEVCVNRRRYS